MRFPERIPGLRWLTIGVGIAGFVWIALEGDLARVMGLGLGVSAVLLGTVLQNWLGGKWFSRGEWVGVSAVMGAFFGVGFGMVTIMLMVLKTGLHGHGPEFAATEFVWVWEQLPLWGVAGLVAGLGLGMVALAVGRRNE